MILWITMHLWCDVIFHYGVNCFRDKKKGGRVTTMLPPNLSRPIGLRDSTVTVGPLLSGLQQKPDSKSRQTKHGTQYPKQNARQIQMHADRRVSKHGHRRTHKPQWTHPILLHCTTPVCLIKSKMPTKINFHFLFF